MEIILKNSSNRQGKPILSEDLVFQDDSLNQINANELIKRQKSKVFDSKKRWSKEENLLLLSMYTAHGSKWVLISEFFDTRSPFSVKNHFYALFRRMSLNNRNELRHKRTKYRETQSITFSSESTFNFPAETEEDLIVESFLVDELKSVDKKLDEKWISTNLNLQDVDLKDPQEIQEKLNEKLKELKQLSAFLEQQLLSKWAWIKAMPSLPAKIGEAYYNNL
ncbi:unnamed protein product [Blepharisma stoltei]|uniref:Myb-like domain-containing protein n=1 Tax=Blepharisma stoltei TaxID=1481888 RepID=A0AAU9IE87_9CILI|nr:unnamed protein product [Blepharisma stoltei]